MLKDKICIVTGASQGIGHRITELFAKNHAKLVFACDIKSANFDQFSNVRFVPLNVCDRDAVFQFIESIQQNPIDVLVNNAGIIKDNLLTKLSEKEWDSVIDVNLKGVFNMTQATAPVMLAQETGSIINMTSVVGIDGNIGQTNYAASKGGVISMTKTWAKELSRKGAKIRVNCVAPGFIESDMTQNLPSKVLEAMTNKALLKRMGTVEDIAQCVLFLASERASYITAQTLRVDGGLSL